MTSGDAGTGAATVLLPGVLREVVDGGEGELRVELADGATMGDVVEALAVRHPALGRRLRDETGALRRHVNLFVDGEDARGIGGLDAPVRDGAVVHVLPAVSGG